MDYDLVVVGGGLGGLATAALAQRSGFRTALLESHTKLGGCAGYFRRGPYTFDAGATALMGLQTGEPIGDLVRAIGLEFQAVRTSSYRVHLPDRTFDIVSEPDRFEAASESAFGLGSNPGRQRLFWRLQEAIGVRLLRAAALVPRLPVRGVGDLWHDLRILGLPGVLAASTSMLTVWDVLRLLGLDRDVAFCSLIAMLLQDTAQAGLETVPFANAAACLHAYRQGMSRPRGSMRSLAEGIGQRFAAFGGDLRVATLVDRVVPIDGLRSTRDGRHFEVVTRRRERLKTRQVAFNLPLDLAARLLERPLVSRLGSLERQSRAAWSAFTGYLVLDRTAVPDDSPLFHQVLREYDKPIHDGNNVLVSLSPPGDEGYGPGHLRIATMSTHTRPTEWNGLRREAHERKKGEYEVRLRSALERALPGANEALVHAEFGSPRSFLRYTRRTRGAVGGPPVSRSNSNFLAVGSDVLGAGLWVVGDSVFPGQGTMATVLSAIRVVERITGSTWQRIQDPIERESKEPKSHSANAENPRSNPRFSPGIRV